MQKKLTIANLFGDAIKGYEMGEKIACCAISDVQSRKKGKYLSLETRFKADAAKYLKSIITCF